jgi:steroid delta-isomerase-like uncharacterized protein
MAEQDNLQISKQAIAAINAHDIDAYLKTVDESYVGESEMVGVVQGREGARQMMTTMFEAFPDFHVEVEQILASGDHVVTRALLTGTHKGNLAGIAPTNKKVSWNGCNIVELRNGKVIRSRIYADNVSVFRQLGVLPAPKATTAGLRR